MHRTPNHLVIDVIERQASAKSYIKFVNNAWMEAGEGKLLLVRHERFVVVGPNARLAMAKGRHLPAARRPLRCREIVSRKARPAN